MQSLKILLVENSADDAELILRQIRKGGYAPECLRVETPDATARALDEDDWDLVISDYNLPQFTALDVLHMVQVRKLDLPMIIVSGCIGEELAVEAMHAGAHDYIMKDNLTRLTPAIERELHEMQVHVERRRMEQALRRSEARLREITETIEEVFWLFDCRQQCMVYVSPAFERLWERPAKQLLDDFDVFLDSIHPEDHERLQGVLQRDGWQGFNEEYRIQRPDGSIRWVSTRSFPIRNDGEICRIAGLTSDITGHKQLWEEKQMMARVIEQTADSVIIADKEGCIEYVNAAFEDITGHNKEDMLNKHTSILKSGLQDDAFYQKLSQTLENGLPFRDLFINRRKDGEIYYEEKTITPVRDEFGEIIHYVSTGKDITQRLKMQQRLHNLIHYDALTGLANRILLDDRLEQAVLQARRRELMVGVLCIGIDLSELLGEGAGQAMAEKLLVLVAQRLKETVRENDTVGHLGQDEFLIIQKDVVRRQDIEDVSQRIISAFSSPIKSEGLELFVSPSIGISVYPKDAEKKDALIKHAEIAMHSAR